MSIPLFTRLEIETSSFCNRVCPSCIRNSDPDKESTAPWFEHSFMPLDVIEQLVQQAIDLGFQGDVCLSHYNEPLLDVRLPDICAAVRRLVGGRRIFFGSNADYLTPEMAQRLDGVVDEIGFSFYMDDPIRSRRKAWVASLFRHTKVTLGDGDHMATHFSPLFDVASLSRRHRGNPCFHPRKRLIVNHRGDMLLCCDDLTGHFGLGRFPESTVEELWFSDAHQRLVQELSRPGGRSIHSHCESCPRV